MGVDSIVAYAQERLDRSTAMPSGGVAVPFSAHTRMSGLDLGSRQIRKGAPSAIRHHVGALGGVFPASVDTLVDDVARRGSTPLVVADGADVLGVVVLKDVLKPGIKEQFAELRRMGIRTVMITGDNPTTADAIAIEAGVDDFLAEALPEDKLRLIRERQAEGRADRNRGRNYPKVGAILER
jgi:K+-transporting ATPase ATPase B chain